MTIRWWHMLVLCVVLCYPCNWLMMKHAKGFYNNDPLHEWYHGPNREMGPSPGLRTVSLVLSPVTAPVNGIYWLALLTFDPLEQPEPPATTPAPMPEGVTRCT